ncbi:MAG: SDR family oxidoreductase, partial [Rhodothermaceae bacterium]|nr:SDR family oxidoreductase [Rhodothermaceae bacterium]
MAASLEDKRIVLTGSTGRLGRHIIKAFAGTGASLITVDRSIDMELVEQNEHILLATVADVTKESAVVDCFAHILDETGTPDMVIHTIGGWDGRPLLDTSLDSWQSLLDLNLTSSFLVFREALRYMNEKGGGLIGITAGQGADRGVAQQAAYSATKGGLTRLIESIADEYKGTGITA